MCCALAGRVTRVIGTLEISFLFWDGPLEEAVPQKIAEGGPGDYIYKKKQLLITCYSPDSFAHLLT